MTLSSMNVYQTKVIKFSGTDYGDVYPKAFSYFKQIRARSKRRPYVRSAYFNKEKVFLDYFWEPLHQKSSRDRVRRMKYYSCAIDLIKNTKAGPISKENPNKKSEILHRFAGITPDKELFFVQINQDKKSNKKFFLSVFPEEE